MKPVLLVAILDPRALLLCACLASRSLNPLMRLNMGSGSKVARMISGSGACSSLTCPVTCHTAAIALGGQPINSDKFSQTPLASKYC